MKEYAQAHNLAVLTPETPNRPEEVARLEALSPDLVILAAYGKILPAEFLAVPRLGCMNVHPSLLPRHRGATPVVAAILAGDAVSGTTLIIMDEGVDTGPIVAQANVPLAGSERTPALTERLFLLGAELISGHAPAYVRGELTPSPQPEEGATFAKRLSKANGELDWHTPAAALERQVRAYDPWPGSATTWNGVRLAVEGAAAVPGGALTPPGTVVLLDGGTVGVATADGVLELRQVKLEGRSSMPAQEFLRGHPALAGSRLPS